MDYKFALSILGTMISVCNNITPSLAIYSRRKGDEINQIPSSYLKINHFCSLLWLIYSIHILDPGLILVNAWTSILSLISLAMYAFYSSKISEIYPQYIVGIAGIGTFSLAIINTSYLGTTCMILNIITTLTCLESVYQVILTSNYSCIDLTMAFSNFSSGVIWTIYGIAIENINLIASSSVLVAIGLILISIHLYYRLFKQAYAYLEIDKANVKNI